MIAYVDNFFLFAHPAMPGSNVDALFAKAESVFKRLNIPLHERMIGTSFKGLGWMWDTSSPDEPPSMICADDKYDHLLRKLPQWATATELPFAEVESIIGFLSWISAGFPIGKPHLAYLRADLKIHRENHCGAGPTKGTVKLTPRAREALYFWSKFIPKWDKRCSVYLDYGPMAGPEVLWRVDASTEWGMGAFMWVIGEPTGTYIMHKWTKAERTSAFVVDRESTGVLEGMAAVRCTQAFARLCVGKRILMEMDNEALSHGIRKCYSKLTSMMNLIRGVCELAATTRVHLRAAHIKGTTVRTRDRPCTPTARARPPQLAPLTLLHPTGSQYNKVADHLSHNQVANAVQCAFDELGITLRRLSSHAAT
jgi:hypothetical protein